jgi:uncharacterized protein YbjQ (UPF0145 family)
MISTTTPSIEGKKIAEYLGVVTGSAPMPSSASTSTTRSSGNLAAC